MVKIAILGYGVVGSGVSEVIRNNHDTIAENVGKEVVVEKILDIRDFENCVDAKLMTKNADDVFENKEISIVVETIGGAKIAYEFTKRALEAGKSVVTSNKELVATHGPELFDIANKNGVEYLFEASVGGGIPIIRPIQQCLAANKISGILGILNGTTNYILTKMKNEGKNFDEALKEAQQNGYAEANPTADIEGFDTVRKIAILSSLAYGEYVDCDKISTVGISKLSLEDTYYADKLNRKIKLMGMSRKLKEGIYARVCPVMIPNSHALGNVEDVFNGIMVRGDALGDAMFYGRGAGALPTASAVVADVMDIAKNGNGKYNTTWKMPEKDNVVDIGMYDSAWFVRVKGNDLSKVKELFGEVEQIKIESLPDEFGFITPKEKEEDVLARINKLENVVSYIRFYK